MTFSRLEQLISGLLEWRDFLIRRIVKVGRLSHGGWETELDSIGFHPIENRLVHFEPSIDAHPWVKREKRYRKKFEAGRKYFKKEILNGITTDCALEQYAVFVSHTEDRNEIADGKILPVDELVKTIMTSTINEGMISKNAVPEFFPYCE